VWSKLWCASPVWLSETIIKKKEISLLNSAVGNIIIHSVKTTKNILKQKELYGLLNCGTCI
jgi:hypothetical protein